MVLALVNKSSRSDPSMHPLVYLLEPAHLFPSRKVLEREGLVDVMHEMLTIQILVFHFDQQQHWDCKL